jgi:hypothetical protein
MTMTAARRKPARRTQPVESTAGRDSFAAFGRRIVRAFARRAEEGDLDALVGLLELEREVQAAIITAGRALHTNGTQPFSWAEIAQATGTSRQAAAMRFGKDPR